MMYVELDWADAANCAVRWDDATSSATKIAFVSKPDEVTERRWKRICEKCPVLEDCGAWVNNVDEFGLKPSGVFAAGKWREENGEAV